MAPVSRVALRLEEAAAALGVSRRWFNDHVLPEIKVFRHGSCTTGDCDGESAWYVVIEDAGEHPYCPGCAESFFNAGMTVRRIPPEEAADA